MGKASLFLETNIIVIKQCHVTEGCWEAVVMTPDISDVLEHKVR